MTHLEDIVKFQNEFDKKHGWIDEFNSYDDKFFERLQYATIALAGEVGEFSNFLKKTLREKGLDGKINDTLLASMKEELADIFIYLVILSIILKVDIGKSYYEKMKFNQKKYIKFEKDE
jgi:NTP pyrophosphatase (non-canonical NTP hydrolase)